MNKFIFYFFFLGFLSTLSGGTTDSTHLSKFESSTFQRFDALMEDVKKHRDPFLYIDVLREFYLKINGKKPITEIEKRDVKAFELKMKILFISLFPHESFPTDLQKLEEFENEHFQEDWDDEEFETDEDEDTEKNDESESESAEEIKEITKPEEHDLNQLLNEELQEYVLFFTREKSSDTDFLMYLEFFINFKEEHFELHQKDALSDAIISLIDNQIRTLFQKKFSGMPLNSESIKKLKRDLEQRESAKKTPPPVLPKPGAQKQRNTM